MKLTEEQIKQIKEQILKQVDSWETTEDKKLEAKKYIQSLNAEQLEQFLIKNKMIKQQPEKLEQITASETQTPKPQESTQPQTQNTPPQQPQQTQQQTQCPFCLITQGKIPSHKIDENKQSIAVLEINPLSKGHTIIISKQHKNIDKIPTQAFTLAKKISRKLKSKLKAKEVSIQSAELFNHSAINVIPIYEDEKLEKKQASESELKELQEKLQAKPKTPRTATRKPRQTKKPKTLPLYPKRTP